MSPLRQCSHIWAAVSGHARAQLRRRARLWATLSPTIVCSSNTREIAPPRGEKNPQSGLTSAQHARALCFHLSLFSLFQRREGASLLASAAAPSRQRLHLPQELAACTHRQLISGTCPSLFIGALGRRGKGQSLHSPALPLCPLRRGPVKALQSRKQKRCIRVHWSY